MQRINGKTNYRFNLEVSEIHDLENRFVVFMVTPDERKMANERGISSRDIVNRVSIEGVVYIGVASSSYSDGTIVAKSTIFGFDEPSSPLAVIMHRPDLIDAKGVGEALGIPEMSNYSAPIRVVIPLSILDSLKIMINFSDVMVTANTQSTTWKGAL